MADLSMLCTRHADTPGQAREWIREHFSGELNPEALQALMLIGSELITNAIVHTDDGAIDLCVAIQSRQARIEVSDSEPDREVAVIPMRDDWDVGGRGLRLVEAYSTRWGCTPDGDRKVIWAELELGDY